MTLEMSVKMKLNDARIEGIMQEKKDTIRRMMDKKKSLDDIADAVGLSIKQVQEMIDGMQAKS